MEAKGVWKNKPWKEQGELMPLTMAFPGKEVSLVSINGGRGLKTRLYSIGLTPGTRLKVLNSGAPGPFLISVRDFKLAIGYGIARKILVK